jgi:hypothetical protein
VVGARNAKFTTENAVTAVEELVAVVGANLYRGLVATRPAG